MNLESQTKPVIKQTLRSLLEYCSQNKWAGYDPYDALNSRVFSKLPFLHNSFVRLVLTQVMKRSPINFRRFFLVPKSENPKGLAVFCSALIVLSKTEQHTSNDIILNLLQKLIEFKSPNTPHYCWGYNFDWQSRGDICLPKFAPNIICTTFAGNALLDAYSKFSNTAYLDMAKSSVNFLLEGLNITKIGDNMCFSYTPYDNGQVHNANLLGAAYLSRLYSITEDPKLLEVSLKAARYSAKMQHEDGSWDYGEYKTQHWIDNFHTGYNLNALRTICKYLNTDEFKPHIRKGFAFYKKHFFLEDGAPKYFHNKTYPLDIHSVAQSIITLVELKDLDPDNIRLANNVFDWAVANMWDERGYFYYQITPYYKNKISYMRWSQAWMLLALAKLMETK